MKKTENNSLPTFQGAGYLLGFAISIVFALMLFVWSENVAVSISAAVPIGTTLGILLEQRFQHGNPTLGVRQRKVLLGLLTIGILLFIALFVIAQLI